MRNDIGFKTELHLELEFENANGMKFYSLKTDLIFFDGKENIIVPSKMKNETFFTNLASIPKYLHWLIPPDKKLYRKSSVFHDFCYTQRHISRKRADKLFLLATRSELKKLVKQEKKLEKLYDTIRYTVIAYSFYAMVRVFGRSFRTV